MESGSSGRRAGHGHRRAERVERPTAAPRRGIAGTADPVL